MYGAYMRKDGVGKDDKTVDVDNTPRRYIETRYFNASKGICSQYLKKNEI